MSVPRGVVSQYAALRGRKRRTAQMAVALITPAMKIQKALAIARSR